MCVSSFVVRKVKDTAVRKPEPRSNQKMIGGGGGGGGGGEGGGYLEKLSPSPSPPIVFSFDLARPYK